MAKRDAYYAGEIYDSSYPQGTDKVWKNCEVCGLTMMVNNYPDGKSRTPKYKGMIICVECDPRHIDDRYLKEGYRIIHKRRLRIANMALLVRSVALQPCFKGKGLGFGCKCASCTAGKFFPPF